MSDLIIKNGQCYVEGELKNVDVAISDGKIQKIGQISDKAENLSELIIATRRKLLDRVGLGHGVSRSHGLDASPNVTAGEISGHFGK